MKNGDMPAMPADIWVDEFLFDSDDPTPVKRTTAGLTKRERFAMAAMQGMLSNNDLCEEIGQGYAAECLPEAISDMAYVFADAMLGDDDDTTND